MVRLFSFTCAATFLLVGLSSLTWAGDAAKPLQGVWVAQSMEADGRPVPPEFAKKMKFTFKGAKLLIAGNFKDDREEEGTYKVDATKSPHQLDVTPPKKEKTVVGIYELKGDTLKICLRKSSSTAGRPTEFATKANSDLVLITFKKQKQ